MLEKTGVPTQNEVDSVFPSPERLAKGPVAVVECFQNIPCNPCQHACPFGAFKAFADISDRPEMDADKCNGCGICLTKCPGLAIMVVHQDWSADKAVIKLPYEFRPLPKVGEVVDVLDRQGAIIAKGDIVAVLFNDKMNKVPIVSVAIDKNLIKIARNIAIAREESAIICRCNDLNLDEIRSLIAKGYTSIEELKRIARLGMGPCQGRNCIPIVLAELSRTLGISVSELSPGTYRPVVKTIELGDLAAYGQDKEAGTND